MSRRRAATKREVIPDARFGDVTLAKFINCIMYDGKRSVAEKIVHQALLKVQSKTSENPLTFFHDILAKVRPVLEVRSRRVGGATYQVPSEVRADRAQALAFRWIIGAARKRSEKTMTDRLANEFLDAASNRGAALKKRDDTHKMAEANRAFAHYRW